MRKYKRKTVDAEQKQNRADRKPHQKSRKNIFQAIYTHMAAGKNCYEKTRVNFHILVFLDVCFFEVSNVRMFLDRE